MTVEFVFFFRVRFDDWIEMSNGFVSVKIERLKILEMLPLMNAETIKLDQISSCWSQISTVSTDTARNKKQNEKNDNRAIRLNHSEKNKLTRNAQWIAFSWKTSDLI